MRRIFVDTFYWIAITARNDKWHSRAIETGRRLESIPLVTTESVLIEFVNFFSCYGPIFRWEAVGVVHDVLGNANVEVVPRLSGLLSPEWLYLQDVRTSNTA